MSSSWVGKKQTKKQLKISLKVCPVFVTFKLKSSSVCADSAAGQTQIDSETQFFLTL